MNYDQLINVISSSEPLFDNLKVAANLDLPQWCIVGGALRDLFWSKHYNNVQYSPLDIDLIYFDEKNTSKAQDEAYEHMLSKHSDKLWRVRNQARMHKKNSDEPYLDVVDAMSKFPLQVDTSGVKIDGHGKVVLFTVYGYEDLIFPAIRPTHYYEDISRKQKLEKYLESKRFSSRWPNVPVFIESKTDTI